MSLDKNKLKAHIKLIIILVIILCTKLKPRDISNTLGSKINTATSFFNHFKEPSITLRKLICFTTKYSHFKGFKLFFIQHSMPINKKIFVSENNIQEMKKKKH